MPRAIRRKIRRVRPDKARAIATRLLLSDILADPDPARVERFCGGRTDAEVRRDLLDFMLAGFVSPIRANRFAEMFHAVDPESVADRLVQIACGRRPDAVRVEALALLAGHDPDRVDRVLARDPMLGTRLLIRNTVVELMETERLPLEGASFIAERLGRSVDADGTDGLHATERLQAVFEETRAMLGTPAGLVYRLVLRDPALAAVWPPIIERLVDEADLEALDLLEFARKRAEGATRFQLNEAFDRARARCEAGHGAPRPEARAWMTPATPDGTYTVIVGLDRPTDGALLASLDLHADGVLPDSGEVQPEAYPELIDDFVARLDARVGPLASVPALEAAAAVRAATRRRRERGESIRELDLGAISVFRRLARPADPIPAEVEPGEAPDVATLSAIFEGDGRWMWDDDDRSDWDLPEPREAADEGWTERCVQASFERAHDLAFAARQRARWHALSGDPQAAAQMAAAAQAVEDDPSAAPLTRFTAERTCAALFGAAEG